MEKAVLPADAGADITVTVEHRKGVILLQRSSWARRRVGRGNVEWCFNGYGRGFARALWKTIRHPCFPVA
jgi:hypothetical protein